MKTGPQGRSQEESNMKKRCRHAGGPLALILVLGFLSPLRAQMTTLHFITYDVSFPFGSTKTFTGANMSRLGVSYQFRYVLKPNLSVGAYFGWHLFHGEADDPITISNNEFQGTISGTQSRYVNAFPAMLSIHYYTGRSDKTRVFFGLNAGTMIIEEKVDVALLSFKQLKVHFGFAPEAGVMIPLGYNFNLVAGVRYNHAFSAGASLSGASTSHSYLSLNIGLSYLHVFFF
jgi:outer membrane protein W